MAPSTVPLTGKALLEKLEECRYLNEEEQARVCGYASTSAKGRERVNVKRFLSEFMKAMGFGPINTKATKPSSGRTASGSVSVHAKGQILVSASYTSLLNVQPGDDIQIRVIQGRKGSKGKIELIPLGDDAEDIEEAPAHKNGSRKKELAIAR